MAQVMCKGSVTKQSSLNYSRSAA